MTCDPTPTWRLPLFHRSHDQGNSLIYGGWRKHSWTRGSNTDTMPFDGLLPGKVLESAVDTELAAPIEVPKVQFRRSPRNISRASEFGK